MKKRVNDLFFIIGLVAVVIMCCSFEVSFSQLWLDIRKAGYWLVAIVGLWFMLYTLNALAWRVILRSNGRCPVRFGRLVKYTVTGFALNSVTPIGLLGGEAYKIMSVSQFMDVKKRPLLSSFFHDAHIQPFLVLADGCGSVFSAGHESPGTFERSNRVGYGFCNSLL